MNNTVQDNMTERLVQRTLQQLRPIFNEEPENEALPARDPIEIIQNNLMQVMNEAHASRTSTQALYTSATPVRSALQDQIHSYAGSENIYAPAA